MSLAASQTRGVLLEGSGYKNHTTNGVQPKQYKENNRKNNKGNKEPFLSKEDASDKEQGRKEQQQRTPGKATRIPVKTARENRK